MLTMAGPEEEYQDYQDLLEEHCYIITEMLDPIKVLPYLRSKHVLDECDGQEIEAKDTRKKKAMCFVDLLKRKGPEGYGHFIDILEKVMPHLYRLLTNKDPRRQSVLGVSGPEERDFCPDCLGAGSSEYLLLATKLRELHQKYVSAKWKGNMTEGKLSEFQARVQAKEVEVEDLQRKLENYEDVKHSYLQLKDQNHNLTEEKSNLLQKVVSYMEESKSDKERLRETMQKLDQVSLELDNEREKMKLERTQSIRLRKEVESQPDSIKLQRRVELLEMELAKEKSKNRVVMNPAVTNASQASSDILKQDLDEAQEKCKEMVEDLYRAREELHKTEKEKEKTWQEKEELRVQCSLLSEEKNNQKKWRETALDQLKQVEKERNEAWQARDDAQTNLRACVVDKDKYWAMVNELTDEIEKKDKEIGQLKLKMAKNKSFIAAQHDSMLLTPPKGFLCDYCGQSFPYLRQTSSVSNRSSDDIDELENFRKRAFETKHYPKFCRSEPLEALSQDDVEMAFDEFPKTYKSGVQEWGNVPCGTFQRTETTTPQPSTSVRSRMGSEDGVCLRYSQISHGGSLRVNGKCNSIADAISEDEICDPVGNRRRSQSLSALGNCQVVEGLLQDGSDSEVSGPGSQDTSDECKVFLSTPHPITAPTEWKVTLSASDLQTDVTIVGGNKEGIFVGSLREKSEACSQGLVEGQQIISLQYNSGGTNETVSMVGLTLEEACQAVERASGQVTLTGTDNWSGYQVCREHILVLRGGDDFYVRSNSNIEDTDRRIKEGDIFHVSCSRYKGTQKWYGSQVNPKSGDFFDPGPMPSLKRANEIKLKVSLDKSAGKKSLMPSISLMGISPARSKSQKPPLSPPMAKPISRSYSEDVQGTTGFFGGADLLFAPYTRVRRVDVKGKRPVLLLGPHMLAHIVAFQLTLPPYQEKDLQFQQCLPDDKATQHTLLSGELVGGLVSRYSLKSIKDTISQEKHCVLTLSISCLQYLHDNSIYPIIIFLKPGASKKLQTLAQLTDKQVAKEQKAQAMDVSKSLSDLEVKHICIELDGPKVKDKEDIVLAIKEEVRKAQDVKVLWMEEARHL